VPLNQWAGDFPLTGSDLGAALQDAFTQLFGTVTGAPLTIRVSYGYSLVAPTPPDPGTGLTTYLPVALYPNQPLGAGMGATVAAAAAAWRTAYNPSSANGLWTFSLSLCSQFDPIATRPLLILESLVFPIAG
jgi:hypothetical protein